MIPQHLKTKFIDFHNTMIDNETLDPKTTFMIELGAAMAVGCYPCMEMLNGVAADKGVSEEELGTIHAIVMAVGAGRVFNQYREVCKRQK
ncbi:MAG: carboxymuconolactone decarboxylase family protein [Desulfobacterales bacterium]|jgi:alkylhydroperoxidase/carboxymuconolactone decarboxylase family protein YurZ